jgi:hypothetical protein
MPDDIHELVCIAKYGTPEEGAIARNLLLSQGIESRLSGQFAGSQLYLSGSEYGVELLAKTSDAQRAAKILQTPKADVPSPSPVAREARRRLLMHLGLAVAVGILGSVLTGSGWTLVQAGLLTLITTLLIVPLLRAAWQESRRAE